MDPRIIRASESQNLGWLKAEVRKNASVNSTDEAMDTPLIIACYHEYEEMVEFLLENNAEVNRQNIYGETALMCASRNGNFNCVVLLLNYEAKIDCTDQEGNSALSIAAMNGHWKIVNHLIKSNANVHLRNNSGCTAQDVARNNGHPKVAKLLRKAERYNPDWLSGKFEDLYEKINYLEFDNQNLRGRVRNLEQSLDEKISDCKRLLASHICAEPLPELLQTTKKFLEESGAVKHDEGPPNALFTQSQLKALRDDVTTHAKNLATQSALHELLAERRQHKEDLMKLLRNSIEWNAERCVEDATQSVAQCETKIAEMKDELRENKARAEYALRNLKFAIKTNNQADEEGRKGGEVTFVMVCDHSEEEQDALRNTGPGIASSSESAPLSPVDSPPQNSALI